MVAHIQNKLKWVLQPGKTHKELKMGVVYQSTRNPDSDGEVRLSLTGGKQSSGIMVHTYLVAATVPKYIEPPAEVVTIMSMTSAVEHVPALKELVASDSLEIRMSAFRSVYPVLLAEYGEHEVESYRAVMPASSRPPLARRCLRAETVLFDTTVGCLSSFPFRFWCRGLDFLPLSFDGLCAV